MAFTRTTERPLGDLDARSAASRTQDIAERPRAGVKAVHDDIDHARADLATQKHRKSMALSAKRRGWAVPSDAALDAAHALRERADACNDIIREAQRLREVLRHGADGYLSGCDPRLGDVEKAHQLVAGLDDKNASIATTLINLATAQSPEDERSRAEFFAEVYGPQAVTA